MDGTNLMRLHYLLAFDRIIVSRGGIPLIEQGASASNSRLTLPTSEYRPKWGLRVLRDFNDGHSIASAQM